MAKLFHWISWINRWQDGLLLRLQTNGLRWSGDANFRGKVVSRIDHHFGRIKDVLRLLLLNGNVSVWIRVQGNQ